MPAARPLSAVVLAAGEGTRMRSLVPKPLHRICGRAMLLHLLDTLAELPLERVVVVVGHGASEVVKTVQAEPAAPFVIELVEQPEPRGTGDAVAVALTGFPRAFDGDIEDGDLLVLPGDAPLLRASTLAELVLEHCKHDAVATLLSARVPDPSGYVRVARDRSGEVARVVEDVDATEEERGIDEVATSVYCFRHSVLAPTLRRLSPSKAKGEYYLTDTVGVLRGAGYHVGAVVAGEGHEAAGVIDRVQLAEAESELRRRVNGRLLRAGVTMTDPERTYLDTTVRLEADVTLLPGVVLEGSTSVGTGAVLGPFTRLVDCVVEAGATITQSVGERAFVGARAVVGPFAVLGPGVRLAPGTVTGPFFTGGGPASERAQRD